MEKEVLEFLNKPLNVLTNKEGEVVGLIDVGLTYKGRILSELNKHEIKTGLFFGMKDIIETDDRRNK